MKIQVSPKSSALKVRTSAWICFALLMGLTRQHQAQTYTFTPCGATGLNGPSQTFVTNTYSNTSLSGLVTVSAGIQSFTVPTSGMYRITASGARGGNSRASIYTGGAGAQVAGDFSLTAGTVIKVLVGQMGSDGTGTSYYMGGGGGGGSYVTAGSTLILAAGGGGGAGIGENGANGYNGNPGVVTTTGNIANGTNGQSNGSPGTNGNGGTAPNYYGGGAGAGYSSNGANNTTGITSYGGLAFVNNGYGGTGGPFSGSSGGNGGYGGGGGGGFGGAGGGGYSGGAPGTHGGNYNATAGGGGGSYNIGTNQSNTAGVNTGNGVVILTRLAGVNIAQTATIVCNGQANAALTASATGGTAPYTYTWYPGGSTSQTLTGLGPGTYTCVATDAASISYTNSFTITEPTALTSTLVNQVNVSCSGAANGAATISVSGGVSPYTYTWSPAGGNSATASGLSGGTYTCFIKDANNCTTAGIVNITEPAPTSILGFATNTSVCLGQTSILIGAGALTYTWSNGVTNGVAFAPSATNVYTVTGTNSSGCNGTATVLITVNALPTIAVSGQSLICNGNSTTLSATGANSYTWNTSSNSNSISVSPTSNTSYTVSGTNSNNCVNSSVITVTVLNGSPVVTASASSPTICLGGSTTLYGSGATSYSWSGGVTNGVPFSPGISGIYTVTGYNACGNGSNTISIFVNSLPNITANASSTAVCIGSTAMLSGGGGVSYTWSGGVTNANTFFPSVTSTYTVTGTDANGCQNTASKTIVVNPLPTITASVTNSVVCLGNTTTLFGGGGVSYVWTGGVTNGLAFAPSATSNYVVTGTDANGCQNTASQTVTVINVPAMTVSATNSAVCQGNSTILQASGANSYTWTNGVTNGVSFVPVATNIYTVYGTNSCGTTTAAITVTVHSLPAVTANASSTAVCIGSQATLFGGGASTYVWTGGVTNNLAFAPSGTNTYTVTGTDGNGCQNTASKTIVVNPLPNITANVTSSIVCLGNTTTLFGGGGVSYSWTGGVTDGVAFAPSATSNYVVTGTDANGCQNTANKTVTVINVPAMTVSTTNTSVCQGASVTLLASGAISYTWTNGVTNGVSFVPGATNTYTVYGTNSCGTTTGTIAVTVYSLPAITANASSTVACIGTPITLYGSGASTYTWTGGITNNVPFVPSTSSSYTVTGTDSHGCQNTAVKSLTVYSLPVVTASATSSAFCRGGSTTLNGGGALTYTWSNGVINNTAFSPTITTTYTVTGTDANGCQNTASKTVTVYALPVVSANVSNSVICNSNSTSFYGGGAHTYTWSGGITNGAVIFPTVTTTYSVTGTNTLTGCTSTNVAYATVSVNPLPTLTITASAIAICQGQSVSLSVSGANTYTWSPVISNGIPFTPVATTNYFVTGKNTLTGCSNIAMQTITVNPLPVVWSTVSSPNVCQGNSVIFNGYGANTYTWSNGVINGVPYTPSVSANYTVVGTNTLTGCTSTNVANQGVVVNLLPTILTSTSHSAVCIGGTTSINASGGATTYSFSGGIANGASFTPSATTVYTVSGTNAANGCSTAVTVTIVVNPLPVLSVVASSTAICQGGSLTLNGAGASTYTWSGGVVNGAVISPNATSTYTVSGTNTLTGCRTLNGAQQTIIVNITPVVSSTVSATTICLGQTVIFTGSGADTYSWTNGPLDGVPFTPTATATYSMTGTNLLTGCTSTNNQVQTVFVNLGPNISVMTSDSLLCAGESCTLDASVQTPTWSTGETGSSIVISPSVTTTYTVYAVGANTCSNSATITQEVIDCTGLNEQSSSLDVLVIYPNPTNSNFIIKGIGEMKLNVVNELGQVVKTISLHNTEINVQDLKPGIYFVTGTNSGRIVNQKVVVTN